MDDLNAVLKKVPFSSVSVIQMFVILIPTVLIKLIQLVKTPISKKVKAHVQ